LTRVEENTIKLAGTVPQFGSRLLKQFHFPRDPSLLGHITARILLGHGAESSDTVLRGFSNNFRMHLFYLHISAVRSFPEVISTSKLSSSFTIIAKIFQDMQKSLLFCKN
jgi:hypothetical protein